MQEFSEYCPYHKYKQNLLFSISKYGVSYKNKKQVYNTAPVVYIVAIVFVKTKALAKVLKEWMESDGQLVTLHPEVFTGVRADEKAGGMTEAQQNSILSRFDKGEIQVLIR